MKNRFKITTYRSKNVKNNKGNFKLDSFGIGITFMSIFSGDSDFDIFIMLGFWTVNIKYKGVKIK